MKDYRTTSSGNMGRNERGLGGRFSALAVALSLAVTAAAHAHPTVRIDDQVIDNFSEIHFDDTPLGGQSAQVVVVLRNETANIITFIEDPPILAAGGFPDQFELVQPALEAGQTLSQNGSTAFTVRFTPTIPFQGVFTTNLFIWTDSAANPFQLTLVARAQFPEMALTQNGFDVAPGDTVVFPETEVGQSSTVALTIENRGDATLELDGNAPVQVSGQDADAFEVPIQPAQNQIAPGASATFNVRFSPTEPGQHQAFLDVATVFSLNLNNGVYSVQLQGEAFVEEVIDDEDANDDDIDDQEEDLDEQIDDEDDLDEEEEVEDDKKNGGRRTGCGSGSLGLIPMAMLGLCGTSLTRRFRHGRSRR